MSIRFDHLQVPASTDQHLQFKRGMAGYFDEAGDLEQDVAQNYLRDKARAALAGWVLGCETTLVDIPADAVLMPRLPSPGVLQTLSGPGVDGSAGPLESTSLYRNVLDARLQLLERSQFEDAARQSGITESELARWPDGLYQFNATQHAYVA